jgi:hypothetical protein
MKKINFVILEDIDTEFNGYGTQIKSIFDELSIANNQVLDNHSDIKELMRLYWDYISDENEDINKKQKIEQYITNKKLKSSSMIYFIDDSWTGSNGNHDGTNFFKKFLLTNSNSINAIILTNYGVIDLYDQMQHTWKLCSDIKADLKNKITNTNVYKQYKRNENKQLFNGNSKDENTQPNYSKIQS